jgi:hypothetical protein
MGNNYKESDLEFLSPQELINVFRRRQRRYNTILTQIIMFVASAEKDREDNAMFTMLLRECREAIVDGEYGDKTLLLMKINKALEGYSEA